MFHSPKAMRCYGLALSLVLLASISSFAAPRPGSKIQSAKNLPARAAFDQAETLRSIIRAGKLSDLQWSDFSDYCARVNAFYRDADYSLAWIKIQTGDGQPTERAMEMIRVLSQADREGLNPEDYDASRWADRITKLRASHTPLEEARFDLALTVSAMRYISDVSVGRVKSPEQVAHAFEYDGLDLPSYLQRLLSTSTDLNADLAALAPAYPEYLAARQALQKYRELAKRDNWQELPPPPGILFPGGLYDGVPRLTQLLRLLGDLPQNTFLSLEPGVYDGPLADAVKRFQARHGLRADGYLTKDTVDQLNVPLSVRVEQLQLAMERYRWMPYESAGPRVVVNLPEFRLHAYDATGRDRLSMAVNVGDAYYDFQTPVFESAIRFMVFRPYWSAPARILHDEVVVDIQHDRDYLRKNRMEVVTPAGEVVTSGTISDDVLRELRSGKLYVRQKPGPDNALGLLKIVFPNEHSVFLHDTPEGVDMFASAVRTQSHGCIHLQNPAELAEWLLRDKPDWDLDRVERAMHNGPDNVPVTLTQPIPILIVYQTAVVNEGGEVHFFRDVYGRDAALLKTLAARNPEAQPDKLAATDDTEDAANGRVASIR